MIQLLFCIVCTAFPYLNYDRENEEAHLILARPFFSAFPGFLAILLILDRWFGMNWESNDTALLALEYDFYYAAIAVAVLALIYWFNENRYEFQQIIPKRSKALKVNKSKGLTIVHETKRNAKTKIPKDHTKVAKLWQKYNTQNDQKFWKEYDKLLRKSKRKSIK